MFISTNTPNFRRYCNYSCSYMTDCRSRSCIRMTPGTNTAGSNRRIADTNTAASAYLPGVTDIVAAADRQGTVQRNRSRSLLALCTNMYRTAAVAGMHADRSFAHTRAA